MIGPSSCRIFFGCCGELEVVNGLLLPVWAILTGETVLPTRYANFLALTLDTNAQGTNFINCTGKNFRGSGRGVDDIVGNKLPGTKPHRADRIDFAGPVPSPAGCAATGARVLFNRSAV